VAAKTLSDGSKWLERFQACLLENPIVKLECGEEKTGAKNSQK
jgi:hypothetical protein